MATIAVNLLSLTGKKGGMERYTREVYSRLGAIAPHHTFVGFASTEAVELGLNWFPGEVVHSGISGENRLQWAMGELFAVSRFARRIGADLVHSPATLGPMRTSMPAVATVHDLLYHRLPNLMAKPAYNIPVRWMVARAVANASWVMADSQATKDDVCHFLGYPAEQIDVVHLAGTPPVTLKSADSPRERAMFLAVGARIGHKNWGAIIRALTHIPVEIRPKVVITGARGVDPLQAVVDETGMQEWVDLRSWVPDDEIEWLYAHATALVVPGLHEGSCLPALEAMHVRLPLLMSDIPVFREVAGDAAGYFDPLDDGSVAAALVRAMHEPQWLADLAERGAQRTLTFTWDKTAAEVLAVFDKVLAARR